MDILKSVAALAATAALAAACAPPPAPAAEIDQVTRPGFASVNSWLLATDDGVVVIDSQRVLSAGADVVAAIEATGRPLLGVIITHPHPDHFGGLMAILAAYPETPVYASAATTEVLRADSNGYQAATRAVAGDDAPEVFPAPDHAFTDGDTLRFGALELVVDEIGAGESETMTIIYAPAENALFVSDVVAHQMTGFVLEGRSGAWIAQIDAVRADYADRAPMIYPGHGNAAPFVQALDAQKAWLEDLRRLVAARVSASDLSDADVAAIEAEMNALYPDYPIVAEIPPLMALNIRAVAAELGAGE